MPPSLLWKTCSIYPIEIPEIAFTKGLDMILVELPPKSCPLMPNGLGYVHNILKGCGVSFQTADINIIMYHRHHVKGIPSPDLWEQSHSSKWTQQRTIDLFSKEVNEISNKLVQAYPRIIGISVNGINCLFVKAVVDKVKKSYPEVTLIAGGYDCIYPEVAKGLYPEFDYLVIGEAELTLPPLISALKRWERPYNLPGVISKHDTQPFVQGARPQNLDTIEFPKYDWATLDLYRDCWGGNTVPIISNRGCHWSRCTFCCECFQWRTRSAKNIADEIQWLYEQGARCFRFNESDLIGNHSVISELCREIVTRKLPIRFTGELRVDPRSNLSFFKLMKAAGCDRLAFGVDGWNEHLLLLQNKGYTMVDVEQNLLDCTKAGIKTDINMVIGVPGEIEEDISESIDNIIRLKSYISCVQNLNILLLKVGSQYYRHPEKYRIKFHGNKDEIYAKYPHLIPPELWYSEEPHIGIVTRVQRLNRIYNQLRKAQVSITQYAQWEVERDNQNL